MPWMSRRCGASAVRDPAAARPVAVGLVLEAPFDEVAALVRRVVDVDERPAGPPRPGERARVFPFATLLRPP
jgi:hypothetical protein